MVFTLFWIFVGAVIGAFFAWNVPQPPGALTAQHRAIELYAQTRQKILDIIQKYK